MTFDLTPPQTQRQSDFRALAARLLAPAAADIDATGRVPDEVLQQLEQAGVWAHAALDAVLALEARRSGSNWRWRQCASAWAARRWTRP
jgi:alkylation response protein AidB-like acyl-CoA dehydrogenase